MTSGKDFQEISKDKSLTIEEQDVFTKESIKEKRAQRKRKEHISEIIYFSSVLKRMGIQEHFSEKLVKFFSIPQLEESTNTLKVVLYEHTDEWETLKSKVEEQDSLIKTLQRTT
jgi:hypothetical protein